MTWFFDLETAGLNAEDDSISIVGVLDDDGVRQWSAARSGEAAMISSFSKYVSERNLAGDVGVSFNGVFFDLPFLWTRCKKLGLGFFPDVRKHLDLSFVCRKRLACRNGKIGFVSKDSSCNKMGLYVPRCVDGGFCALVAKQGKVSVDNAEGLRVFEHNAVDLVATALLFKQLRDWGVLVGNEDEWLRLSAEAKEECEGASKVSD